MKSFFSICFVLLFFDSSAQDLSSDSLLLKTAKGHPMQYYISLPKGWKKEQQWPVVVVIESADKEYRENALRFVRARKDMPFILVAPFNVNNSRSGRRDPAVFPYSEATWDYIDKTGDCKFNMDGLTQLIADIQQEYNGEAQYYITGFEAGAHTVWQMLFQHPERLKAAAPVAGNYNRNSCMEEPLFSKDPSRVNLPVRGFAASLDSSYGPHGIVYSQWLNARQQAVIHGYTNIAEMIVPGKGHVPLPAEVMNWFYQLWESKKAVN